MADDAELQALLSRCAQRDHSAFERLYQLSSPKLFSICRYMLRNEALAEEALQEAYVQIWRDAANFNPTRSAPLTWLGVIARHRCLDLLRRNQREFAADDNAVFELRADEGPGPLELTAHWSDKHALGRCLETLSQQQRLSVTMAFFRGLSHQQLSTTLATPVGTIKSWIRRGLQRLKNCLEQ